MLSDTDKNKIVILIPSLNPGRELIPYIDELIKDNYVNIVVINDGSAKEYDSIFNEIELKEKCTLLKHEKNYGKGKAIKTGLEYILNNNINNRYVGVITADSDGQHLPKDITKVAEVMIENPNSLILGTRDFKNPNVPAKSSFRK